MNHEMTFARTDEDLVEIADLMSKVFASRSYFDFYKIRMDYQTKDPFYKPEFSRLIRVDGKIVSHVSVIEKHLRIGGAVVKVGGIGDVCTHPAHRGKGYTNLLMNDSIRYMAENRMTVSMLYGIMNFYHKFGYIEAANAYKTVVPLKNVAGLSAGDLPVRPFQESDRKALNALYNKAFAGKTLAAERVVEAWYGMVSPKTCVVVTDRKDRPAAYAITSAPPAAPALAFHVKEAVAFDAAAANALTFYLRDRARDLQLAELEIHQRPDSFFVDYLMDFGCVQTVKAFAEGEGQAMLRIVLLRDLFEDLREELSGRLLASARSPRDLELVFKTDIGEVALRAGKEGITLPAKASRGAVTIKTPQNHLTRLVVGHWSVERFLRRIGKEGLAAGPRALLETLFPAGTPYLCEADYF